MMPIRPRGSNPRTFGSALEELSFRYTALHPNGTSLTPSYGRFHRRTHGEFLRFLYILAHRRTKGWFERLGYEPSEEAFKFRRGQYFWHTRAAVGHATALAVSRRARLSERALRRNRTNRHTSDDLLYPPTAPVAF